MGKLDIIELSLLIIILLRLIILNFWLFEWSNRSTFITNNTLLISLYKHFNKSGWITFFTNKFFSC